MSRHIFAPVRWLALALALALSAFAAFPAGAVDVQRVQAGDLEAWLVEDHSNPLIAVTIAFRGGAATDPVGKEGLARMAAGLLDEGAGDLDAQAFQRRLNELAIELGFSAGLDTVTGDMRSLTENRDQAFDLLRLALQEPRFDAEPIARVRGQFQASIRQQLERPATVASLEFFSTMFPDHPYGRPVMGTSGSLDAIGGDDLRGFVNRRIARDNLVIGVVGDITPEELAPLLRSTFGGLPAAAAPIAVVREGANAGAILPAPVVPVPQARLGVEAAPEGVAARADGQPRDGGPGGGDGREVHRAMLDRHGYRRGLAGYWRSGNASHGRMVHDS